MIGHDLLRYNKEQLYICWDFETAHLNLASDNFPWQVAWLIATKDRVIEKHNHYINWGDKLKVSDGAARATGFNPLLIKEKGEDPLKIYNKFNKDLRNPEYLILGQNLLNFDVYVEKIWATELGLSHDWSYLTRLIDTNALAKAIIKKCPPDKNNLLAWQYKLIDYVEAGLKTNLGLLCKNYQIDVDKENLHKADYDVYYNWQVWRKQMMEIEI